MNLQERLSRLLIYYPVTWLYAGDIASQIRGLQASQHWPRAKVLAHQAERLRALVRHAARSVPAYRSLAAWDAHPLADVADVACLPFIHKTDIQARAADFLSRDQLGPLRRKTTGGSTGVPVTIWKTRGSMLHELAATWRGYSWAGVGVADRQARFWGVPFAARDRSQARLVDAVCNRRRLSAFAFGPSDMDRYAADLHRFRPRYFYGYVSMLTSFAEHVRQRGATAWPDLRCIITTSEVLGEAQRALLAETFGVPVYNEYGCGELGTIAHECERGGLHVNDENLLLEVVDGQQPCEPGNLGELVITELNNYAMPLVRYRTGDYGVIATTPCSCGRTLTLLEKIYGRAYDFVTTRYGRRFHGEFMMYIFEEAMRLDLGIEQFQVEQRGYDDFLIRIVPGGGYDERAREFVRSQVQGRFDPTARVEFAEVASIERERSGKLRLIIGYRGEPESAPHP